MRVRPVVLLVTTVLVAAGAAGPAAAAPAPSPTGRTTPAGSSTSSRPARTAGPRPPTSRRSRRPAGGRRTATTSSRMYASCLAAPNVTTGRPRDVLQGRDVRREGRRRRADVRAALRRHDRARQGLRRPARLRLDPRRRDVRARLRGRRGPPVLHRRAAPPRARAAVVVRGRRRRTATRPRAVAARPLHRGRPAAPGRPARRPLRRRWGAAAGGPAEYVAGINQYIAEAKLDPAKMPGEYAAIGRPLGPTRGRRPTSSPPRPSSAGSSARAAGGSSQAELAQGFWSRFGSGPAPRSSGTSAPPRTPRRPRRSRGTAFPYQAPPAQPAARQPRIPDPRPLAEQPVELDARAGRLRARGRARSPSSSRPAALPAGDVQRAGGLGARVHLRPPGRRVRARRSATSPRRSSWSRTCTRPGSTHAAPRSRASTSTCSSGHGRDYAWSATSAGQDIIDTFAVDLCEPGGGTPTIDSTYYLYRGQCLPMETLERTNAWTPNAADQTPAGSETLRAERTEARHRHRARHGQRQAGRLHAACARPTSTRSTRPAGSRLQRPRQDAATPRLPAGGGEDRLHVQLALRRRPAHRVLQLGRQPGPRGRRRPDWPDSARRVRVEGLRPRPQHGDVHAASRSTPRSSTRTT